MPYGTVPTVRYSTIRYGTVRYTCTIGTVPYRTVHYSKAVVTEARGLRAADRSRPGDVVALDFFADGRHLVIDAVMTTVYRNTVLEKVATVPGYEAKQAEDRKFAADKTSR